MRSKDVMHQWNVLVSPGLGEMRYSASRGAATIDSNTVVVFAYEELTVQYHDKLIESVDWYHNMTNFVIISTLVWSISLFPSVPVSTLF